MMINNPFVVIKSFDDLGRERARLLNVSQIVSIDSETDAPDRYTVIIRLHQGGMEFDTRTLEQWRQLLTNVYR